MEDLGSARLTSVEKMHLTGTTHDLSSTAPAGTAELLHRLHGMPKLDLHCHLSGSISTSLLAHLERLLLLPGTAAESGAAGAEIQRGSSAPFFNTHEQRAVLSYTQQEEESCHHHRTTTTSTAASSTPEDFMHHCFTVFDEVYKILTNLAFVRLAVQDVLFTAAAENMLLLEVRTSLRDGLRRSFRPASSTNPSGGGDAVTKETYVDVVIETVEHLLSGGLVDFNTGELLSAAATATVRACGATIDGEQNGDGSTMNIVCADAAAIASEAAAAAAAQWWAVYDRVYAALLQPPSFDQQPPQPSSELGHCRRRLLQVVLPNLTERLHVRLLLSINRGASVAAASEAAHITTRQQQRQIKEFHTWCCNVGAIMDGDDVTVSRAAGAARSSLQRRLRQTCWVTGVDLSGNCYKGSFAALEPALIAARRGEVPCQPGDHHHRLSDDIRSTAAVTLHGGEKADEAELEAMMAFSPDRWGHLVFTSPAQLSRILSAQQGIELCLTSNLVTCGHADVASHHLGALLHLWRSLPGHSESESEGQTAAAAVVDADRDPTTRDDPYAWYVATESARVAHRLMRAVHRWRDEKDRGGGGGGGGGSGDGRRTAPPVLPNISFHTDDRGVFGTTLTHELYLASTHPAIVQLCAELTPASSTPSPLSLSYFLRLLQRLSVTQVFELPLPVQLLATLQWRPVANVGEGSRGHETEDVVLRDDEACIDWRDWDAFVRYCGTAGQAESHGAVTSTLPARLSRWEWRWLTACFDAFT